MGRLIIYEIMFYGDSTKKIPLICKIKDDLLCAELKKGKAYVKTELEMEIIQDGEPDNFLKNTNEVLIVDDIVKNCLAILEFEDIEIIPVNINEKKYYIINVLRMLKGSLNKEKSKYTVFKDDFPNEKVRGKIGTLWKVVLNKCKISGHIFRIEEYPKSIFVDEYFKNVILENGFTGLNFNKIDLDETDSCD